MCIVRQPGAGVSLGISVCSRAIFRCPLLVTPAPPSGFPPLPPARLPPGMSLGHLCRRQGSARVPSPLSQGCSHPCSLPGPAAEPAAVPDSIPAPPGAQLLAYFAAHVSAHPRLHPCPPMALPGRGCSAQCPPRQPRHFGQSESKCVCGRSQVVQLP